MTTHRQGTFGYEDVFKNILAKNAFALIWEVVSLVVLKCMNWIFFGVDINVDILISDF